MKPRENDRNAAPVSGSDDARSDGDSASQDRQDAARQAERGVEAVQSGQDEVETRSHELASAYVKLGGGRCAVMDDNTTDTRKWESDQPEAEAFWQEHIAPLPDAERKQVEQHLPSVNLV